MSYIELLNKLADTLDSDTAMPAEDKAEAQKQLQALFNILWKYSD